MISKLLKFIFRRRQKYWTITNIKPGDVIIYNGKEYTCDGIKTYKE